MSHGFTTHIVTIKAYGYYTGVFGNFLRVGDDGDLSVSGSVNQNNVHYTTTDFVASTHTLVLLFIYCAGCSRSITV